MTDKRCLVYETLGSVSNLQVSEAKGDGLMRLQGVFGVCGIKNQNNRVYDKDNYAQMVESLQKKIKESGCPGELEHPNSMNINLENVSHKIEDIQMNEDGTITGSIVLLNTPKGQIAKAIVEGGLPLFISSRGAGTITNEGRVTLSTIQTYDLVGTPGFSQAKLTLKTNQTLECLNEGLENSNETWVIVEGDDSDKQDDNEPKEEPKNDDKPKDEPNDKPKEDPKEEPKKDDNKNNDNKDIDMKELKEAIDKLTEKVTSLEAELHVAQESLNEVKSIKPTNYEGIQKWITEEFAPDFQNKINEGLNTVITEKMNGNSSEEIQEAVKTWINDEFTSQIKSWVTEEFAPLVQDWVVEEFAPEVQNWVVEEFAPEVQNWIVEEYSPELQNWVTEEFAPEIQGWITEEFAPTMENWLMEEYTPEQSAIIEQKVNENVSAFMESQKAGRLDEIDGLLESIAAEGNADVQKIVEEHNAENKYKGVYVVENMPAEYRPSWELLNEAAQQNIIRSSKMYDFTKEGVLESFWANVDFGKKTEETKPVVESKNPVENYQNSIIANMKRLRGMNA